MAENVNMSEILQMRKEIEEKSRTKDFFDIKEQIPDDFSEVGFEEIAAALLLPEDQFALLAPQILLEMQKTFNDPNDRLMMVQTMNSHGLRADDYHNMFLKLSESIETELKDLSKQKQDFLKQFLAISANAMMETEGIPRRIIKMPVEIMEGGQMPKYARLGDAGLDVYAAESLDILPGETKMVSTGLKVALPLGYAFLVQPRSGMSAKSKIRVANTPGLIDSGFRGEIKVILENIEAPIKDIGYDFNEDGTVTIKSIVHGSVFHVEKGDRIAQLRLVEVPTAQLYEVAEVPADTDRGAGGFGSTGTN